MCVLELIVNHFIFSIILWPHVSGLTALCVPWHLALYCTFLSDMLFFMFAHFA